MADDTRAADKAYRARIFKELVDDIHSNRAGVDITLSLDGQCVVVPEQDIRELPRRELRKTIEVVCEDTIDYALRRAREGKRVLVLNMASERVPGGGVSSGCSAQEEELCRRTTLYPCLSSLRRRYYPLSPGTVVYTPRVDVLCDASYNYLPVRDRVKVDVVTCAAARHARGARDNAEARGSDMEWRISRLFRVCSQFPHDVLVLGAWGCGAFGNPPREMSQYFRAALETIDTRSEIVAFAVLPVGARGAENLKVFREVLKFAA